jgi:acetyl esterase/lipase
MTSAMFYVHGGGYVTGSVEFLRKQIEARVEATGIPWFAPRYRLAPEHPHPILHEDCFAALKWLHGNAADMFGVDNSRLSVFGESAGGGLTAGLALTARDEKLSPPLAKQILVYPMMDDRNTISNPEVEHLFTWSHDNNKTAWKALIGDKSGEIDCYGAAARATNLRGPPSTYLDVGSLDIFVHDSLDYAQRLMRETQRPTTSDHIRVSITSLAEIFLQVRVHLQAVTTICQITTGAPKTHSKHRRRVNL